MNLESFKTSKESLVPLLALNNKSNKNIIIFPTDKEAIEFSTDFSNLNKNIYHLPSWDTLSYDSFAPSLDIQGKRLEIAHLLLTTDTYNIATSIKAISQRIYFEELEI
jgi:transcription-repair coupling factor (superfamily II helicase)